uniref:Uncharacterized protein n=1 Tax=Oryza brachyantha TaxID=4533 RepID=J3N8U9_ORYBR
MESRHRWIGGGCTMFIVHPQSIEGVTEFVKFKFADNDRKNTNDKDRDFEKFSKLVEDCQIPLYDGYIDEQKVEVKEVRLHKESIYVACAIKTKQVNDVYILFLFKCDIKYDKVGI